MKANEQYFLLCGTSCKFFKLMVADTEFARENGIVKHMARPNKLTAMFTKAQNNAFLFKVFSSATF